MPQILPSFSPICLLKFLEIIASANQVCRKLFVEIFAFASSEIGKLSSVSPAPQDDSTENEHWGRIQRWFDGSKLKIIILNKQKADCLDRNADMNCNFMDFLLTRANEICVLLFKLKISLCFWRVKMRGIFFVEIKIREIFAYLIFH